MKFNKKRIFKIIYRQKNLNQSNIEKIEQNDSDDEETDEKPILPLVREDGTGIKLNLLKKYEECVLLTYSETINNKDSDKIKHAIN